MQRRGTRNRGVRTQDTLRAELHHTRVPSWAVGFPEACLGIAGYSGAGIEVCFVKAGRLPALSFPIRGRQLVPILVIVARERFHLVQDLGVAIQRLQIVHNGGLSWLHSRLIQIGDAQVCAAANQ